MERRLLRTGGRLRAVRGRGPRDDRAPVRHARHRQPQKEHHHAPLLEDQSQSRLRVTHPTHERVSLSLSLSLSLPPRIRPVFHPQDSRRHARANRRRRKHRLFSHDIHASAGLICASCVCVDSSHEPHEPFSVKCTHALTQVGCKASSSSRSALSRRPPPPHYIIVRRASTRRWRPHPTSSPPCAAAFTESRPSTRASNRASPVRNATDVNRLRFEIDFLARITTSDLLSSGPGPTYTGIISIHKKFCPGQ